VTRFRRSEALAAGGRRHSVRVIDAACAAGIVNREPGRRYHRIDLDQFVVGLRHLPDAQWLPMTE